VKQEQLITMKSSGYKQQGMVEDGAFLFLVIGRVAKARFHVKQPVVWK
jgi:hypothetical protein